MRMIVVIGVIFLTFASGVRADDADDAAVSIRGLGCAGAVSADWSRAQNASILTDYLSDRPSIWQDSWKVYVKTSPCSGRFDWVTVAQQNPTGRGGSGYWQNADLIIGGTPMLCVREFSQCTKAAAEAEAVVVRGQPQFRNYCCKEYSVWKNQQTGKMTIVVGKFGTAPAPFEFEDGPMCCDEAEAMSGITGACGSGTHGGGTGFGPMSQTNLQGTTLTFYRGTTPEKCQADCGANPQCKAFSLIKAGAYAPNDPPMCYLISAITVSGPSSCCISAVKSSGGGGGPQTSEVDLSGTWQAVITESNTGNTFRYDLVLGRAAAGKWNGTLTLTSSPNASLGFNSAATLESLGGGNMRITYFAKGRNQQGTGTFTKDAIFFGGAQNSVRFTRR